MSLPWSGKTLKAAPVSADEVMILDSEDTNPDTINKRATLLSLPSSGQSNTASNVGTGEGVFAQKVGVDLEFKSLLGENDKITLLGNTDDITFTLGDLVVITDQANRYTDGFKQSFVANGTTAGININTQVPNTTVTGDIWRTAEFIQFKGVSNFVRTVVITDEAQTLTDKTFSTVTNIFQGLTLGDTVADNKVVGASSDLTDGSNIALLDAFNIFTAGIQSPFFQSESGSPADGGVFRLARVDDIAWRNFANDGNLLLEVDTGDFLTFDSSFIAATATQGTSGDVLTSNGVGLAPTFQDAASGVFPVSDDVMIIEGSADNTKQLRFEVDGLTGGIIRIITPPDASITLVNTIDGTISNANVNSLAAIDFSKLAALTSANILVGDGSAVATSVAMTGDIAIDNTGLTSITPDVIVNADVNSLAAIDFSKLAALTSANILVGSGTNVVTSVAMSGDITISNLGVTSIGVNTIFNANVDATAAIDFSKLAALTSTNILVGSGSNVATSVVMSGDTLIDNVGAVTAQSPIITGKTLKALPVTADQVLISDSEDSDNLKRITIASAVGVTPMGVLMASYLQDTPADNDYFTVSGGSFAGDTSFVDVASPVPDDLTLSRLTVNVIGGPTADTTFALAIADGLLGNSAVVVLNGTTGSFTDVSNTDVLSSGTPIAYRIDGAGNGIDLGGASSLLKGT